MSAGAAAGPPDAVGEAQQLFAAAAEAAGTQLTQLAAERGKDYINERDHLQPTFKAALEDAVRFGQPRPEVSPTLGHGLDESLWPRLGKFDVSLRWARGQTVFGELKCGDSQKALSACAWDAAKCAFCLRHEIGAGMLLVAAAPKSLWQQPRLGTELFADGEWDMAAVRARYAKGFTSWESDGYKPVRVPDRFATFDVDRVEFHIADMPWVLGIARVEPLGDGWLEWSPFLPGPGAQG